MRKYYWVAFAHKVLSCGFLSSRDMLTSPPWGLEVHIYEMGGRQASMREPQMNEDCMDREGVTRCGGSRRQRRKAALFNINY